MTRTITAPDLTGRVTLGLAAALLLLACGTDPATTADDAAASEDDAATSDTDEPETTSPATATTGEPGTTDAESTTTAEPTTGEPGTTGDGQTTGEPAEGHTFVLVHGAWMGAWSWQSVAPLLEAAGHEVRVVELPAHGDDATDPHTVTLDGYRDAVLAAVLDAGEPVVLVGHSMGGMVISAAAEAEPDGIEALVYVAGYLPADGQSLLDLSFTDAGSILGEHLVDHGDGTASIEAEAIGEVFCADCTGADVALLQDHHRPEAFAPLATPVALTDAAFGSVPRYYVHTAQDVAVSPVLQAQMVTASPVAAEATVDTAHAPMLSDPASLAAAIVELVP